MFSWLIVSSSEKPSMSGSVRSSTAQSNARLQRRQRLGAGVDGGDLEIGVADQLDDALALHLIVLDHQQAALAAGQELLDARELLFQPLAATGFIR
jgi:hypothetical protein